MGGVLLILDVRCAWPMQCQIRQLDSRDIDSLARIYTGSNLELGTTCYTPEQVEAWSSYSDDAEDFSAWLTGAKTFVAVDEHDECLGFGGLEPKGRVSSLFVAPQHRRKGIASRLLERLIEEAKILGFEVVTTEASEFSKPLFEKHGFVITEVEHSEFKGVDFTRYAMQVRI